MELGFLDIGAIYGYCGVEVGRSVYDWLVGFYK